MATVSEFIQRKDRKKFGSVAEYPLPLEDTLVGIEVEVDQDSTTTAVFPTEYGPEWDQKHDGSLSNGYEYVLSSPLQGQAIVAAAHKLYQEPTKVGRTYTGSTHIHVDMLDSVDLNALRTLVLLTYAFENILYASGDISRQWCGYANRLSSAPSDMIESIMTLEDFNQFSRSISGNSRYYGLNLQALTKFGSAEFRYFPTAESAEELLRWVKLVLLFKKAAMEIGTTEKLIDILSTQEGYNDFIATYFSEFPDEVEATGGYDKIKSLMTKALIISRTTGKRIAGYNRDRLLAGKYKTVVDRARKKIKRPKIPKGFKLHLLHTGITSRRAPSAHDAVQSYIQEHGEAPSLSILIHFNGDIYYANKLSPSNPYEWTYAYDVFHISPQHLDMFFAAVPIIRQFIQDNQSDMPATAVETLMAIERSLLERQNEDEEEF